MDHDILFSQSREVNPSPPPPPSRVCVHVCMYGATGIEGLGEFVIEGLGEFVIEGLGEFTSVYSYARIYT